MTGHQPPDPDHAGPPAAWGPAPHRDGPPPPQERPLDRERPDRLYTVTKGRTRADERAFDAVTLVVAECDPQPGQQSEYTRILRMTRRPMAVVEISAQLRLPVSVVKILLCDLLDLGHIAVRHPTSMRASLPDLETLEQVLIGLRNL